MKFTSLIFGAVAAALSCVGAVAAPDTERWEHVGQENFRYRVVSDGVWLLNETVCELAKIELQTYPSASTPLSRVLGTGSYYYKLDRLERGRKLGVPWKAFSNKEGQVLDVSKYAFNRISIHAIKCPGKDETRIGEHYGL